MMTITIKFFAIYRQLAGIEQFKIETEDTVTVADVITQVEQNYPELSGKLSRNTLVAINEQYARREQQLRPNDTVAFFPPVSGG